MGVRDGFGVMVLAGVVVWVGVGVRVIVGVWVMVGSIVAEGVGEAFALQPVALTRVMARNRRVSVRLRERIMEG